MGIILSMGAAISASFFLGRSMGKNEMRAIMFREEKAPIKHLLALHGRSADLVDCFQNILESKNTKALESVKQQLSDFGLDHISDAFVKGFKKHLAQKWFVQNVPLKCKTSMGFVTARKRPINAIATTAIAVRAATIMLSSTTDLIGREEQSDFMPSSNLIFINPNLLNNFLILILSFF